MAYFPIFPVPLLANLTNGNSYLPPLSTSQANLLALHQSASAAALNDNGLDFNRSKLCQLAGAGPMDLESLNDERNSYVPNAHNAEFNLAASNMRKLGQDLRSENDNLEKNFASINPMYNGMGVSSQNLLMMPGVMNMLRDTQMMPSLSSPYAMMNQQLSAHSPSKISSDMEASPTTSTNSAASNAKETITCKSCILLPPTPSAPAPTTRERPNGEQFYLSFHIDS